MKSMPIRFDRYGEDASGQEIIVVAPHDALWRFPGVNAIDRLPDGWAIVAPMDPECQVVDVLLLIDKIRSITSVAASVPCVLWCPALPDKVVSMIYTMTCIDVVITDSEWTCAELRLAVARARDPSEQMVSWMRRYHPVDERCYEVIQSLMSLPLGMPMEQVARHLFVHRSTVFRFLKRYSMPGQSEWIRLGSCLRVAARLQADPSCTIEAAALHENFPSATSFRSQFRRRFGVNISEARQWIGLKALIARYWCMRGIQRSR